MTVTGEPPRSTPADQDPAGRPSRRRDAAAVREVCPFVGVDEAAWRSAYAAREHQCHAVQPPTPLAVAKQRQLCLVSAHGSCATYRAAMALREERSVVAPGDDGAALWPAGVGTPVVLEPARRMGALPTASAKSGGQALLVGLMVVAFLVLVIARTQTPAGSAGSTPAASAAVVAASPSEATPEPSDTPEPTPAPTEVPSATPETTAAPTAEPTPAPTTVATRTYKVKSGDTLSSIAAAYGTTVKKIAKLNGITDPRVIHVGQVLQIP